MLRRCAQFAWKAFESLLNALSYDLRWKPYPLLEATHHELKLNFDFIASDLMMKKKKIFFVEIGANDGVTNDPIYRYVQNYGWSGIMVEPLPEIYDRLKENYRTFPNITLLNFAINREAGEKDFYAVRVDSCIEKTAHQYSSFRRDIIERHAKFVPDIGDRIEKRVVKCITFQDLLEKFVGDREVDVLQIDTEGYDYEILKMIDFKSIKPSVINFEHCHLTRAEKNASVRLLINNGYRMTMGDRDTTAYLLSD